MTRVGVGVMDPMTAADVKRLLADDERTERVGGILKALGHPVRLRIVGLLCCDGEKAVGDICRDLGLPQAAASQQIGILRLHGLVSVRRTAGFRRYSIAVREVADLLSCMTRCHLVAG